MVNQVIKERIDLYSYPTAPYPPKSEAITIGDLHGNTLKFAHFLLRHNIIKFKDDITDPKQAYQEFVEFYETSKEKIGPYQKISNAIEFDQQQIEKKKKFIENIEASLIDKITNIMPEGLTSYKDLQSIKHSDEFQIVLTDEDIEKEAFKAFIKSQITEKGISLTKGLVELLPELESTFPNIYMQFNDLIPQFAQYKKEVDFLKNYIESKQKNEKKLEETSKPLHDIVPIFNKFMEKLEVSDNTTLVRLIGDEFADRGNNDYFTLRLLDFLHENGVRVHTTISNHSNEFISAYESKDFNSSGLIKPDQQTSFLALKSLVNRGLISKEEINVLIERSYKPTLKVVDYTLDEKGITLFTHAPVDFMLIKKIADKLGVNYSDATKESLATTIDEINKAFGDVVAEHRVHELCNKQEISEPKNMTNEEMTDMPLMCIIWNRWNATKDTEMARPATINGYSCTYVHGHDDYSSQFENIINLDTSCGKEPRLKEKERKNR